MYDDFTVVKNSKRTEIYVRNFIFGVEDSLVSTVGFVSGIAAAGLPKENIFLSGMVLIFVEAFSMGVGSYLSEDSAAEYTKRKREQSFSIAGAGIMFFSYLMFGLIPLSPYIVFTTAVAFPTSIVLSLIALFLLGALSAQYFQRDFMRHGLKMLVVGGLAIAAGIVVGQLV